MGGAGGDGCERHVVINPGSEDIVLERIRITIDMKYQGSDMKRMISVLRFGFG